MTETETTTGQEQEYENVVAHVGNAPHMRAVRFRGRQVAVGTTHEHSGPASSRWTDWVLWETPRGYRVHVEHCTIWQGEHGSAYMACVHGEDCPSNEYDEQCKETVLTAQQVSQRWPSLARRAGIEEPQDLDVDAGEGEGNRCPNSRRSRARCMGSATRASSPWSAGASRTGTRRPTTS